MPAQQDYHDKFVASGQVERLARNLDGTCFTPGGAALRLGRWYTA